MNAFLGLVLVVGIAVLAVGGYARRGIYAVVAIVGFVAFVFFAIVTERTSTLEPILCWYGLAIGLGGTFGAILFRKPTVAVAEKKVQ